MIDSICNLELYKRDIEKAATAKYNWQVLNNKCIFVTGATGMVGSCIVDILMYRNQNLNANIKIVIGGRNQKKAQKRFQQYWRELYFYHYDVYSPLELGEHPDYIIHAASHSHPSQYAQYPVETIEVNVLGIGNILKYVKNHTETRVVFLSTVEVYGQMNEGAGDIKEKDMGYIDCNTVRAGYPESKRLGESYCQAYREECKADIVIPRLSRVYGPTMLEEDSKAVAEFIKAAVSGHTIELRSSGEQIYSYTYVVDAAAGVLVTMIRGESGEAYNISDNRSVISLKELAEYAAKIGKTEVELLVTEQKYRKGYSNLKTGVMNSDKLQALGWEPHTNIKEGVRKTIDILKINGYR